MDEHLGAPGLQRSLLSRTFTRSDVTAVRHAVARAAAGVGMSRRRLDDFVLAINEIITNAVRHGGGQGRLRLWSLGDLLWCEVADRGPGMPRGSGDGSRLPPSFSVGGRGLWLARHLCDTLSIQSGPQGTVIRLGTAVSPPTTVDGGPAARVEGIS